MRIRDMYTSYIHACNAVCVSLHTYGGAAESELLQVRCAVAVSRPHLLLQIHLHLLRMRLMHLSCSFPLPKAVSSPPQHGWNGCSTHVPLTVRYPPRLQTRFHDILAICLPGWLLNWHSWLVTRVLSALDNVLVKWEKGLLLRFTTGLMLA
jgi:hypothetical protein